MSNTLFKILLILLICNSVLAANTETCSRVAKINYQDVLVDNSSHRKGEGLRFYLEKDPQAKMYLDKYQKNNESIWRSAVMGTLGFGLLLAGVIKPKEQDPNNEIYNDRKLYLLGGVTLLTLNYLITYTANYSNEENLKRAVLEYNKRNLPRIHFSPFQKRNEKGKNPIGILGEWIQEF